MIGAAADLEASVLSATVGQGYRLQEDTLVTPYLGVTVSSAQRLAYSEAGLQDDLAGDGFTFNTFKVDQLTAIVGMTVDGKLADKVAYHLGYSLERGLSSSVSDFTLSGDFGSASFEGAAALKTNLLNLSAGLGYLVGANSAVRIDGYMSHHSDMDGVDYELVAQYRINF